MELHLTSRDGIPALERFLQAVCPEEVSDSLRMAVSGNECARVAVARHVVIQLADPSRAGLVIPSEQPAGQDVLMLMMPMLIND